ncbi:class II fumarate hydratase [Dactylosporangium sp. AC04546]|uniref:class II fumarate hydratase n=1 Tax=Dactylosporangium sp. AC04546 TaxID=2862460 RepID=UPI001EDE4426|nr:class II fumarate hydratase [Dactylosporangium sp. AC04546]WVK86312.1 class II fumarate hydratase [Dactylosporangium sp. AC04546]
MTQQAKPHQSDLPIGIDATGTRTETDSLGAVEVPANRYWGAQTQRSLEHFDIGDDRMPKAVYHAYGYVKKAAAVVNFRAGRLPEWKAQLITRVADEVIAGRLDSEFPLYVWQTGSGTQSNMNVNEVIANRAIQLTGGELGSKAPIHPNDDVNMGQSSNDTFPTAMHIAAVTAIDEQLVPALGRLHDAIAAKSREWSDVVKIGRTHLEDATPLTVGQEWSGYAAQLHDATDHLTTTRAGLYRLAMGGTAVGTGLNAPPGFGDDAARAIASMTGWPFVTAPNKFAAQGSLDALVRTSAALRGVAVTLFKFANDLRWLGSGPRTGLHELDLPANEPGSSIMPGKVNPTQAEAMLMVCVQVIGSDTAVAVAGGEGNFELNAFRPIIISNVLHSVRILADMTDHLRRFLVEGARLNEERLRQNVDHSVMLVTALSPVIGYDKASEIAHFAVDHNLTLKDAALQRGVSEDLFDRVVVPSEMTQPGTADLAASR